MAASGAWVGTMGAGGDIGIAVRAELRRPGLSGGRGGRLLDGSTLGATGALTATGGLTGAAAGLAAGLAAGGGFAGAAIALDFTGGAGGVFFNGTFDAGLPAALAGTLSSAVFLGTDRDADPALAAGLAVALFGMGAFFTTLTAGLAGAFEGALTGALAGDLAGGFAFAAAFFTTLAGALAGFFAEDFAAALTGAFDFLAGAFTICLLWGAAWNLRSLPFPAGLRRHKPALPDASQPATGPSGGFAGFAHCEVFEKAQPA